MPLYRLRFYLDAFEVPLLIAIAAIGSVPVPYIFYSMSACEDSKMPFASTHPPKDENTKHAYVCSEYNPQVN